MKLRDTPILILVIGSGLWLGGILLAPVLKAHGYAEASGLLYSFYGHACHQQESRSFILDGYKLGVCARCTSIYSGFTLVSFLSLLIPAVVFRSSRVLIPVFIGILIIDGLLSTFGIWDGPMSLRAMTGLLGGIGLALMFIPVWIEAVRGISRHSLRERSHDNK